MRLRRVPAAPAPVAPRPAMARHGDGDMRELARRTVARDEILLHTLVRGPDGAAFPARLVDISPYGCQVRANGVLREQGDHVDILLPLAGPVGAQVMWGLKGIFGCKFGAPIDPDLYRDALARIKADSWTRPDAWPEDGDFSFDMAGGVAPAGIDGVGAGDGLAIEDETAAEPEVEDEVEDEAEDEEDDDSDIGDRPSLSNRSITDAIAAARRSTRKSPVALG